MEPPLEDRIFLPPTPPIPPGANELGRRLGAGRGAESAWLLVAVSQKNLSTY